jgi:hypothetical protein
MAAMRLIARNVLFNRKAGIDLLQRNELLNPLRHQRAGENAMNIVRQHQSGKNLIQKEAASSQ